VGFPAACVALNLLILGYYKYAGFTVECVNALIHKTGRTLRAVNSVRLKRKETL